MGATNRSSLAYVAEVTKGTTPSTPAFKGLRETSNTLAFAPTRTTSNEIRVDRQVTDQVLVDLANSGNIGIELSFAAFDDMLEAAFQGTWAAKNSRDNAGTADSVITNVATSGTVLTCLTGTAFVVGQLVLFSGFGVANNNGLFKCSTGSATVPAFSGSGITDETVPPAAAKVKVVGFQGASADITATASGLGSTSLDFTTLGLNVGEWVKIGGDVAGTQFATAADNSWARISAIAATALTFDILPASWATDTGTGKTIQVFTGDFLTTGTVQRAFSFERQQQDLTSPSYELFKGCQVDNLSLDFKAASIVTGSLDLTGLTATAGTSRTAGATDVAAPAYPVLNASTNVGRLMEGGAVTAAFIQELGFDLKNNLDRETAISNLGAVNIRDGEIALSGTLSAYFSDLTLLNKVLADTVTSLMIKTGRADGNRESILLDIPQAKLSGTAPVSAKNASRMFTGTYDAYRHATLGYTAACQRYWYLPVAN